MENVRSNLVYKYSITPRKHFDNAWPIINLIVGFSLATLLFSYHFNAADMPFFVTMFSLLFLAVFIPQLTLHLRYYYLDRGRTLYYYPNRLMLSLELRDGRKFDFPLDDFEHVELNQTFPFAERRVFWFPWDSYNYSVIRLKNGQQFVITSLLVLRLDVPLDYEMVKLRKKFYTYPFRPKEVFDVEPTPELDA